MHTHTYAAQSRTLSSRMLLNHAHSHYVRCSITHTFIMYAVNSITHTHNVSYNCLTCKLIGPNLLSVLFGTSYSIFPTIFIKIGSVVCSKSQKNRAWVRFWEKNKRSQFFPSQKPIKISKIQGAVEHIQ